MPGLPVIQIPAVRTYGNNLNDWTFRKMKMKNSHLVEAKAPIMFSPSADRAMSSVGPIQQKNYVGKQLMDSQNLKT